MSLCICRLPTKFNEPEFARIHREWRNEFQLRTNNQLAIADGLAYLKTPQHFLPSIDERARKQRLMIGSDPSKETKLANLQVSEIDQLMATEGIPGLSIQTHDDAIRETKSVGDSNVEGESFQHDETLWLIVKYKASPSVWTLPFTHRRAADSTSTTLTRLCEHQLRLKPHFPSWAPISFRKLSSKTGGSTRMFYYKALFVPKSPELKRSSDSDVLDSVWVNRAGLQDKLPIASWTNLRDALSLD